MFAHSYGNSVLCAILRHINGNAMKKILLLICFFAQVSMLAQQVTGLQRPKLVVGIVIDQMRWDYLYRYHDRWGQDGFRRIMKEGHNCQNTMINYLPSFTGPGHAAVYTGSVPAIHGIAANDWIAGGKEVYCAEDKSVKPVGGSIKAGQMSPVQMLSTTITDELKLATQHRAKVIGVGLKDRGSILPAGHAANAAYWFDDSTGNFITSSYYMSELPDWIKQFNDRRWADSFLHKTWHPLYPVATYVNSTADDMMTEGKLTGEMAPVFPHNTPQVKGRGYNGIRYMPWGNTLSFKAARACIRGEAMGQDDVTDFLCLTLSSPDYAGHNYGPDAVEMEDMYLRLDNDLASFLSYLDKHVGKGQYTLFITADHGAAHNADYLKMQRIPAGNDIHTEVTDEVNSYLKQKFGAASLVKALTNYQVYLDDKNIEANKLSRSDVKDAVAGWLKTQDGVAMVVDMEDFDDAIIPAPLKTMIVNGYHSTRSGCIQVILESGWYSGHAKTGTTHGSWNPHDTHIPLLWYGWGISKGEIWRTTYITDIAPTLAALLHIQMPNGNVGSVITETLKK